MAYLHNHTMTHNDTHDTRLGGLKQDLQVFKSEFNSLLTELKKEISSKFENVSEQLNQLEENFNPNKSGLFEGSFFWWGSI